MDLDIFRPLAGLGGPFASVTIDVTRTDRATIDDMSSRWRELAQTLTGQGAPAPLVESLAEPAVEPSGRGGEWTRVLVANGDGVALDRLLPVRPPGNSAAWGPVPDLVPGTRALGSLVAHAVVRVDRTGADIHVTGDPLREDTDVAVEGDHDELTKVQSGGMAQKRFMSRVEDSWEHNAAAVAEQLEAIVRRYRLDLVLVMGDVRAISYLEEHAGGELRERIVKLHTGGRAAGTSHEAESDAVAEALARHRASLEAALVDRFAEQRGRHEAAVEGINPVAEALARGQVEQLLLVPGNGTATTVWVGSDPLQVSPRKKDAEAIGGHDGTAHEVPAKPALLWAAVASGAGATVLDEGQLDPVDGVAAILRWSDESTR